MGAITSDEIEKWIKFGLLLLPAMFILFMLMQVWVFFEFERGLI